MRLILGVFLAMQFGVASATATDWGDLHLRFKYDGEPPEPRALVVDKDVAVCGKAKLLDESLLVDKETRGIANVVVMLLKPKEGEVPVHESYEKTAKEPAKIVSRGCRFEPHVLVMRTTQPLHWQNDDPTGHNPRFGFAANRMFGDLIPANGRLRYELPLEEPEPVRLECTIHGWMNAVLIVHGNPYAAQSDQQGKIALKNVPAGEWTFRIWHERAGNVKQVQPGEKVRDWPTGGMKLTIKPSKNDIVEFKIPAEAFKRK